MREELVYFVAVFEALPAPSDLNPYGEEGRCYAKPETPARPVAPLVETPKRVPSKAEYVKLFALAGALPKCVRETRATVTAFVREAQDWFGDDRDGMPRRLRKAIARLDLDDLATFYDTGAIGRVAHYLYEHQGREFVVSYGPLLA